MSNSTYARMWQLNSVMIRRQGDLSRRERILQAGAWDADRLIELNARDRRALALAKREHAYWKQAYILEYHRLITVNNHCYQATLDDVVLAQQLVALDLLGLQGQDDPEMEDAAKRGLLAWEQALERMRADLERYGKY